MLLAVDTHDAEQIGFGQDGRGAQDGVGDLGLVIGQAPDEGARGVGAGREAVGQLLANRDLHVGGQVGQDRAVEFVFLGGAQGRAEEVVGQLAQQGAAAVAGGLLGQGDQRGKARFRQGDLIGRGEGGGDVTHGRLGS